MWSKSMFCASFLLLCCYSYAAIARDTQRTNESNIIEELQKENKMLEATLKDLRNMINDLSQQVKESLQRNQLEGNSKINSLMGPTVLANEQSNYRLKNLERGLITKDDTKPTSCDEAMKYANSNKSTLHLLKAPNRGLVYYTFCAYEYNAGWTVIQRRQDGSENFFRSWRDYKGGFGDLYGEYWLGLDILHDITVHRKHELWILLRDFDGGSRFARYSHFAIAGEDQNYALTVSGYSGNAGDSLSYSNGRPFSTFDNDNDGSLKNCAERDIAAWWYFDCAWSNLNGQYMTLANRKTWPALYWFDYLGFDSLKYAHMAIRPVT